MKGVGMLVVLLKDVNFGFDLTLGLVYRVADKKI